jgi:type VI secretion system protein ImpA
MIEVEELLAPISAESSCGEDVSYDPRFLVLDALVAGKPETQFAAAEEPDWKAVRDTCLELFQRTKNLRVAIALCLALLKLEGAAGLRNGLMLLNGLLERYWRDLYPKLDPEENDDSLERTNILSSLAKPLSTFGDPMQFLQRLRQIPLANSRQLGRLNFADIAGDAKSSDGEQEKPPLGPAEIKAAFRDTDPNELLATGEAISECIALARSIDSFLTETVGAARAPDMSAFVAVLLEMGKCLAPYLPKTFTEESTERPAEVSSKPTGQEGADSGIIRSRGDVIRALNRICQYYSTFEPSSPLPFLLRRAQRLVEMDFLQIINELTPEARTQLETIIGVNTAGGEGASSEEPGSLTQ